MKAYGNIGNRVRYGYYDDGFVDRGGLNYKLRKRIDEDIELHYNGYDDWLEDISKVDPFLCDCTLRPDIDFYIGKQDNKAWEEE